jgi:hypothetical protein
VPPTDQMFCDQFIAEVIQIGRLITLKMAVHDEPPRNHPDHHEWNPDERVEVACELAYPPVVPGAGESHFRYEGAGRTLGLALRDAREKIRYGTGE